MLEKLKFYITHSLNDMRVNKRLSFFALLSIAAGVADCVSFIVPPSNKRGQTPFPKA